MMSALPRPPAPPTDQMLSYLHLVVPNDFRCAVDRHHAHMVELAELLKAAKLPREEVAAHLDRVVDSYRAQLLLAVDAYTRDQI